MFALFEFARLDGVDCYSMTSIKPACDLKQKISATAVTASTTTSFKNGTVPIAHGSYGMFENSNLYSLCCFYNVEFFF